MAGLSNNLFYNHVLLAFLVFCAQALAGNVLYSVISTSPTSNMAVVSDRVYPLQPSSQSSILFQGYAPSNVPYFYAIIDNSTNTVVSREDFDRPAVSENTLNEFYGRSWNKKDLASFSTVPNIPRLYNRRPDEDLHPRSEIPTIHVIAAQSDIDNLHKNSAKEIEINANITYIRANSVKTFKGAKFEIGGRSTRSYTKFAYNIKLDKKSDDSISGFKKFKLRSTVTDPSYARDYLFSEMLGAVNQPVSKASYVRVFLNNRPVGLYIIMEKYDKQWLKNEFGNGSKTYNYGVLYKGKGGKSSEERSSLAYLGEDPVAYSNAAYEVAENPTDGTADFDELIRFTRFIHEQLELQKNATKEQLTASIPAWKDIFDVEGFLVVQALEFMSGSWDTYLLNTNNYFIYKCPATNKLYYITWDFDYAFGSGPVSMKKIAVGDYRNYGFDKRPLTNALFTVPEFRALFESHLQTIVETLLQPNQLVTVVESLANFIQDDVAWDKTVPHVRKGIEFSPSSLVNLAPNKDVGLPEVFSVSNSIEYVIRVNSNVPFKNAIRGKTGHSSLYGILEWFDLKLENYAKGSTYSPLLPFIPLKEKK